MGTDYYVAYHRETRADVDREVKKSISSPSLSSTREIRLVMVNSSIEVVAIPIGGELYEALHEVGWQKR